MAKGKKKLKNLRKPSIPDRVTKTEAKDSKSNSRGGGKLRKSGVKAKGTKCFHEIKKSALTEKNKIRISESVKVALKKDK